MIGFKSVVLSLIDASAKCAESKMHIHAALR